MQNVGSKMTLHFMGPSSPFEDVWYPRLHPLRDTGSPSYCDLQKSLCHFLKYPPPCQIMVPSLCPCSADFRGIPYLGMSTSDHVTWGASEETRMLVPNGAIHQSLQHGERPDVQRGGRGAATGHDGWNEEQGWRGPLARSQFHFSQ